MLTLSISEGQGCFLWSTENIRGGFAFLRGTAVYHSMSVDTGHDNASRSNPTAELGNVLHMSDSDFLVSYSQMFAVDVAM